jgi:hypothetical protein
VEALGLEGATWSGRNEDEYVVVLDTPGQVEAVRPDLGRIRRLPVSRVLVTGAEGIIGVQIDSCKWREDVSRQGTTRQGFKIIVTVVGTAIAPIRDDKPDARQAGLRITPARHLGTTGSPTI